MRSKIPRKIPTTHQKSTMPPSIATVLTLLRDQFSEDDLDNNNDDVELSLDSEEDYDATDTEDELEFTVKAPKKLKKKVKFDIKEVPGAPPIPPPIPTAIDTLSRQMEDLRISQAMVLRELSAVKTMGGNANMEDRKCIICDRYNSHRPGVHGCPEVNRLVDEGLAKFTPSGQLMRPDGSDLPCAHFSHPLYYFNFLNTYI